MSEPVKISIQVQGAPAAAAAVQSVGQAAAAASQAAGGAADAVATQVQRVVERIGGVAQQVQRIQGDLKKPLPGIPDAVPPKIKEATVALEDQAVAARKAGESLGQVFNSVFRLAGIQSPFAGQVGSTAAAAKELAAEATAAAGGVGVLVTGAVAAVAALAVLAAGLYSAATSAAKFNDEAGKQADAVGLSVEAWTKLRYAAELNNVPAAQFQQVLLRLSKAATEGSKAFEVLGIEIRRADGTTKDSGELFADVADKFASYKDGIEKTALAQELLGLSSKKVMTLFNGGSEGLRKYGEELQSFGGVTSKQAAEQGDRLGTALQQLGVIAESLWVQFGSRVVPVVLELAENLVGAGKHAGEFSILMEGVVFAVSGPITAVNKLAEGLNVLSGAFSRVATAGYLVRAGGSFKDALGVLAARSEEVSGATATSPASVAAAAAATPKVDPPNLKAIKAVEDEKKRQAEILEIREKGQLALDELVTKSARSSADDAFRAEELRFADYYAERKRLIDAEFQQQMRAAEIELAKEVDVEKGSEKYHAAEILAIGRKQAAEEALGRERDKEDAKRAERAAKEIEASNKELAAFAAKQAAAQQRYADGQAEMQLRRIGSEMAAVENNQLLSAGERRAEITRLIEKQLALLPAMEAMARIEATSSDLDVRLRGERRLLEIETQRMNLQQRIVNMRPPTFLQAMGKRIDDLQEKWGNFSQNMVDALTGPIENAMNNLGDTVIDLASGMKSWGEVGLSMARQLASGFITAIGQMMVSQLFFHRTTEAQKAEKTATNTAALGPAAALAGAESGISFGTAAVIGLVAFAALMAAALAFEKGGRVPGGEQFIRVNERGQETVMNASATSRWSGLLDAINAGATSAAQLQPHLPVPDHGAVARHQSALAEVGGRSTGMTLPAMQVPEPRVEIHYVNTQREVQKVINSRPGRKILVKHINNARGGQGFEQS